MTAAFLLRSSSALEEVTQHVDDSEARGTVIEAFLAQHILVVICAEVQQEISRLIKSRIDEVGSIELTSFTVASCTRLFRSVMTSEIAGLLGHFSRACKDSFNEQLDDRLIFQYNAAVKDRHAVAHTSGVQITLNDARQVLEHADLVLAAAAQALGQLNFCRIVVSEDAPVERLDEIEGRGAESNFEAE